MGRVHSLDTQRLKTGMKIYRRAKNSGETHTDNLNHRGVLLYPYVYIGGIKSTLVRCFTLHPFSAVFLESDPPPPRPPFNTQFVCVHTVPCLCSVPRK